MLGNLYVRLLILAGDCVFGRWLERILDPQCGCTRTFDRTGMDDELCLHRVFRVPYDSAQRPDGNRFWHFSKFEATAICSNGLRNPGRFEHDRMLVCMDPWFLVLPRTLAFYARYTGWNRLHMVAVLLELLDSGQLIDVMPLGIFRGRSAKIRRSSYFSHQAEARIVPATMRSGFVLGSVS